MLGMRVAGPEQFVVVSYDFEYQTEEGKQVWMKEGEVLLLLSKTNNDWWQVIRRGDRRPFYAPARYVLELRADDTDWESGAGETVHYRPDNGEPLPASFGAERGKASFSTFLGNKRSSYAPPPAGPPHHGPQSDFLFGAARFQERYRSNSMDSILVADMNRQLFQRDRMPPPPPPHHHHHPNMRQFIAPPPPAAAPAQFAPGLEKRPTFDNIDKRASWSQEPGGLRRLGGPPAAAAAASTLPQAARSAAAGLQKKPVPLPRSKIPVPAVKAATIDRAPASEFRTFKRSKTDLSLGALSAYKAGRSAARPGQQVAPPAAAASKTAAQGKRSPKKDFFRLAGGDENKAPANNDSLFIKEPIQVQTSPNKSKTSPNKSKLAKDKKAEEAPMGKSKPAIKEKPVLSGFKSSLDKKLGGNSSLLLKASKITRVQSESDLIHRLEAEALHDNRVSVKVEVPGANSSLLKDTIDMVNGKLADPAQISPSTKQATNELTVEAHNLAEEHKFSQVSNKLQTATKKPSKVTSKTKSKGRKKESFRLIEEEPLPEPPPTPPVERTEAALPPATNPIVIPQSEPLVISTEPMSVSSASGGTRISVDEKSNCSTSFDSTDGSLDSSGRGLDVSLDTSGQGLDASLDSNGSLDWVDHGCVKSPSTSTCSRAPPSPATGLSPIRLVTPEWEEYLDSSGRKFYCNKKTKEKSWKPPRRTRGSSDGYSAPTSPDPFVDLDSGCSAFESSPGTSEPENGKPEASGVANGKAEEEVKAPKPEVEVVVDNSKEASANQDQSDSKSSQEVPSGYEVRHAEDEGRNKYYVNIFTGVSWYSATDQSGRTYYYEENGNESCWTLPNVSQTIQDHSTNPSPVPPEMRLGSRPWQADMSSSLDEERCAPEPATTSKTETLMHKFYSPPVSTPNFQIGNVSIVVLKQGPLCKTKLVEHGKKYRKNWSSSHVVLTDTFLLFFKDAKAFASIQSGSSSSKPDQCIDLKGAQIEWCNSDKSKRSNVFEIATVLDQRLLLQDDDFTVANDWFCSIENVIVALSQRELVAQGVTTAPMGLGGPSYPPPTDSATSTLQGKGKTKVSRTKSLKLKLLTSSEDVSAAGGGGGSQPGTPLGVGPAAAAANPKEKSKIREKLRKFFLRRPGMEDLMRRGIMKNEPVFGSTLALLARAEHSDVPAFVRRCIQVIESRADYLRTDGVYRQSGNLSVIQKIRLQIDQGNLAVLDTVDDVHVLSGALKLFFRELKEPLVPWDCVDRLLAACNNPSRKGKARGLREIVGRLPPPHQATLLALLRHLDRVTVHREVNRMAAANLAIVFGPTLMWPPPAAAAAGGAASNMALNMMQQNLIVEALLTNVHLLS